MIERIRRVAASEPVRLYLYGVGLAVIGLLAGYGLIEGAEITLWAALLVALLGVPAVESARARVTPSPRPTAAGGRRRRYVDQ